MFTTRFSQETRHGEPDVTRPYDQNIDGLRQRHIDLLSRDFLLALSPHFQDNASARGSGTCLICGNDRQR
jgi:hypothetical protein